MTPDELRDLLTKKDESEELRTMRMRVAELVTENAMLKQELEKAKETKKDIDATEREFLKFLGVRVIKL